MLPDRGIRESVWPTNDAAPSIFVPAERLERYGAIKDSQIQPASLDVRLDSVFIRHPSGERTEVRPGSVYSMAPGECLLGSTVERLRLRANNVAARVEGKSFWGRQFLSVHSTAGFIDPGFIGDVTLELKNEGHARLELRPGVRIAQISFHFLAAPAERLYGDEGLNSHYQRQFGVTGAQR